MEFEKFLIGILSFIGGLLSKIIYDIYENHKKGILDEKDYDKKLYIKIKEELLPLSGGISFIKDFNFAGFSFKTKDIDDFFYISDTQLDNPDLKFLDKKLEKLKNELFNEIKEFVYEISTNTFPLRDGLQSIPSEWEIEKPEKFNKIVEKIHNHTGNIWTKYNEIVDYGRKKFKI